MRLLYVSQYFPPEPGAPAARVHELSREWVRRGHDVTVLTGFPHHPVGLKRPGDRGVLFRREDVDGIRVERTYVYAVPNQGTLRRMLSYASFAGSAALLGAARLPRPDVVIATSPQLLCGAAGWWLSRAFGVPFVFEVRDLWPESILAVEAMRDNLVIRGLKGLARFLYTRCDRIVTVGEGYRRGIHERYGIPLAKMDVVPNGVDAGLFQPGPRDNSVRREFGWGDRFVAMYLGTHGMAHALDGVLRAADLLRNDPHLLFVFVGEGAEKESLKRRASELRLPNVQFIDAQPKARVPLFYAACDVGLVTLRNTPLFQEVLPSKIFEYLGMERAVLLSVGGEARRLVEEAGAGTYVPPEDAEAMAGAIRAAMADRSKLGDQGRRGREHVLRHFDRGRLAERYLDLLKDVLRSRGSAPAP